MIAPEAQAELARLARRAAAAASRAELARRELAQAIHAATAGGATNREVGEAIGRSHTRVQQILAGR
jgi:hypothetical protein